MVFWQTMITNDVNEAHGVSRRLQPITTKRRELLVMNQT
jgi:hypothetical protein